MNSFQVHNDYMLGKGKQLTPESLMANLWTVEDIRHSFGIDISPKPLAEECLTALLNKNDKELLSKPDSKDG
jgi:hypothetical protein